MANLNKGSVEIVGQDPYMDYSAQQAGYTKTESNGSTFNWNQFADSGLSALSNFGQSIFGQRDTGANYSPGMPGWVLPVAIGGIGIIGFAVLAGGKKKRR
jgi:hypothetical protein